MQHSHIQWTKTEREEKEGKGGEEAAGGGRAGEEEGWGGAESKTG